MKKFILLALLSIYPSVSLAVNSTVFNACTGCQDYIGSSSGGSGSSIYPATATASFPFGLTASTITLSTVTVSGQIVLKDGTIITSTGTFAPVSGSGSYIQNRATLQAGSTAYPDYLYVGSSASVNGSIAAVAVNLSTSGVTTTGVYINNGVSGSFGGVSLLGGSDPFSGGVAGDLQLDSEKNIILRANWPTGSGQIKLTSLGNIVLGGNIQSNTLTSGIVQGDGSGNLSTSNTFSSSSYTFLNPNGIYVKYDVKTGSVTFNDGTVLVSTSGLGGGGSGSGIVSPGTFTWVNNFGFSASTITVSSNTVLPGATFYQNGPINFSKVLNVISSMTVSNNGTHNSNQGVLDIYTQITTPNQTLLSIGSDQQQNQLLIRDQQSTVFQYGIQAGTLNLGPSVAPSKLTSVNSLSQYIDLFDATGNVVLQTNNFGGPGDIVLKAQSVEELRVSTSAVTTSTFTILGVGGYATLISSNAILPGATFYAGGYQLNVGTSSTGSYLIISSGALTINSGTSGQLNIRSGDAVKNSASGGGMLISAGTGKTNGFGGSFINAAGQGGATGSGGSTIIAGGSGGATSGDGGFTLLEGGSATGNGDGGVNEIVGGEGVGGTHIGGDVLLVPGSTSGTGRIGQIQLYNYDLSSNYSWFDLRNVDLASGNTQMVVPPVNSSGTLMLAQMGRTTGKTAAATLKTVTVPSADSSYLVSANILPTVATLFNFIVTCAYTDESNTARTLTLQFSNLGGAFVNVITNAAGTVPYEGVPLHIRAKSGTTITLATANGGGTNFTTVTYNGEASITQIN